MKRILVTGGTGFVGKIVVARLLADNFVVRMATRSSMPETLKQEHVVVGSIGPNTKWEKALQGVDAVVHLAARAHVMYDSASDPLTAFRTVNTAGTRRLVETIMAEGPRPLVFISSLKAMGEFSGQQPFTEATPPKPVDPYGISKREAEIMIQESGIPAIILRSPLIYGPGVRGNFRSLLDLCWRRLPLPLGSVHNRRSLIGVQNLAGAIAVALHKPEITGTYLVHDGETVSTTELIRAIGKALNRPALLFPFPPALLRQAAALCGRRGITDRLLGTLEVDDTAFRTATGWQPMLPLDEGLKATAQWYRRNR